MRTGLALATLSLVLLGACTGTSGNGPKPSDLVGSWKLIDLQGFNGTAHTRPDADVTLRFSTTGVANCFASTSINVDAGILHVGGDWVSRLPTGCPKLDAQQGRFLYRQILTGTTGWDIRDDRLTLSKSGVAAAFERVGYNFDWTHPDCFRWNRLDDASKSAAARDFLARLGDRPTTETSRASVVKIVDDSCADGTHAPLSPFWRTV